MYRGANTLAATRIRKSLVSTLVLIFTLALDLSFWLVLPALVQSCTYSRQKSPTHVWKEAYKHAGKGLCICQKRPACMWKEVYMSCPTWSLPFLCNARTALRAHHAHQTRPYIYSCEKGPTCMRKKAYMYLKRGLNVFQKRPVAMSHVVLILSFQRSHSPARPLCTWEEPNIYVKRGLHVYVKSPVCMHKCNKRPTCLSKEASFVTCDMTYLSVMCDMTYMGWLRWVGSLKS